MPQPASQTEALTEESLPYRVIEDFLPTELALSMRADIDAHFNNPRDHKPQTHQIWNYWYVPGLYTYLRTNPDKLIRSGSIDLFMTRLRDWSADSLGMAGLGRPYLSFYPAGCRQGLHNDSRNGRFAFVYSLTRNERQTIGGQTILLREGNPFRDNLRRANAGSGLYELVEPRFNRLVVFDDRLVHGVEQVAGSMDPLHGRFVMHGHIEETAPIVVGGLRPDQLTEALRASLERFVGDLTTSASLHHGPLVLRFKTDPDGKVTQLRVLVDRVYCEAETSEIWHTLRARLLALLQETRFPTASQPTLITLPIAIGGPVRRVAAPTPASSVG